MNCDCHVDMCLCIILVLLLVSLVLDLVLEITSTVRSAYGAELCTAAVLPQK